jgi:hypothetical protein
MLSHTDSSEQITKVRNTCINMSGHRTPNISERPEYCIGLTREWWASQWERVALIRDFLGTIFYGTVFLGHIFEPELIFYPENGENRFLLWIFTNLSNRRSVHSLPFQTLSVIQNLRSQTQTILSAKFSSWRLNSSRFVDWQVLKFRGNIMPPSSGPIIPCNSPRLLDLPTEDLNLHLHP